MQHGYDVVNLNGGYKTYSTAMAEQCNPDKIFGTGTEKVGGSESSGESGGEEIPHDRCLRLTMSGTRDEVERWDGAIEGWGTFGD